MTDPSRFNAFAGRLQQEMVHALTHSSSSWTLAADPVFNERALELFRLQFESVEALGRVARSRGTTPDTIHDWRLIPDLPAAAFKDFDVTWIPGGERVAIFQSSGTTGTLRSRHAHNALSLQVYETSLTAWFDWCVLDGPCVRGRRRIVSLTPEGCAAPQSSLAHMASVVIRECGAPGSCCVGRVDAEGGWHADLESVRSSILGGDVTPVILFGTAFSFVHLLDDLKAMGRTLVLPPGSRVMETGGYKGRSREMAKAELHRSLAAAFGILESAVVTEYGMSELSSQAYDRRHPDGGSSSKRRTFRFPPWARALVISPENGQEVPVGGMGMLRVIDLANVGSSLAVATGDMAIRHEDGFELIGRPSQSEPRGCSLTAA